MHAEEDALERRIVTVLFADLVGFTPLSERLDAEDVAAIQDRYFALARETINRYGGRIEKFIGDAVMAVFGAERSRDDDVERAVRAGLALVSGVQQLNAAINLDEEVLQLRVGLNTGEAVVAGAGDNEGRVTGDTVNTAARFQAAAPAGGVLIGESTALAVAEIAELGEPLKLELKGKSHPTSARVVTGLRTEPSREQAMGALRAPTVGREQEVAVLKAAIERTRGGAVERWLIVAPPGVGKSRVLREVADSAEATHATKVWRSRSRPGAVSPFEPIAALFRSALTSDDYETTLLGALSRAGVSESRARVVADVCLSLVSPLSADAGRAAEDREALFLAWLDGLNALARSDTQVWLVEDIHWAGGDLLDFLATATRNIAPRGRLIAATARPSLLDDHEDWSADSEGTGVHVVRLETLPATHARNLVLALVGDALPDDLVDRVVERSDGNCLFIEELLRTWVSVGTLVRDSTRWRLDVPADEVPLPQSVQQIYAAQLDDLPPDARRLARRASVAGRRFPVRALEPLGADDAGLDPLRRRELVTGPVTEPLLGDAYSYRHALLRDAGYASLARAERARLHLRLARWLEQAAGDRSGEVAELIASHYAAVLESAPALASSIPEGLDRAEIRALAATWFERAGLAALALSAHEAARDLLRRSIDMTSETDVLAGARRWERLADATAYASDMSEGARAYEAAMDLYRRALTDDRPQAAIAGLARAASSLANVWYQQIRFVESRDLARRVRAELPDADDGSLAILLVAEALGEQGAHGGSDEVRLGLERAVELSNRTRDAPLKLRARQALNVHRSESGAFDAQEWLDIAEAAVAVGDIRTAVSATINGGSAFLDDAPRAVDVPLARARDMAEAHGLTEDIGWVTYCLAESAFVGGDWDAAITLGAEAMDLGEANDYYRVTVRTIHVVAPIAAARGDVATLKRCQDWYDSLVGKFVFPDSPYSRIVRPAVDLDLADYALCARYAIDPASRLKAFTEDPGGPSWLAALDRVMREWCEAGEIDGATTALNAMEVALANATDASLLGRGTYHLMRARVAVAERDADHARSAGARALDFFRRSDAPWWKAKAIRLLERAGAADSPLLAEVDRVESALGVTAPTK